MLRPRILTGLLVASFAGVFAAQVSSCTLDQGGTVPGDPGKACTTDSNCDDTNPCTTEVCLAETKLCKYETQPDGPAPAAAQIPEDCNTVQCISGKPVDQNDDTDVVDDNNTCTENKCTAGTPSSTTLANGSTCTRGGKPGQCNAGDCEISCTTASACDDGLPCTDEYCNSATSKCVYTNLDGVPTPGAMEIVGDCRLHLCSDGQDTLINDDADVFDDNNPCTIDVCLNGTPDNPNQDTDIPCVPGEPNVCNGSGACVECTLAVHCIGIVEDECTKRNCVDNKCEPKYMGQETLASAALQMPSDCNKVVCNGAGGTTTIADDTDLPNDGNACTKDLCKGGTPDNPPEAQNTVCGNGLVCDDAGVCVGCNMASQCMGTDDFCKTRTCNNNQCGWSYKAAGTDLNSGQTAGNCKVLECDGAGNTVTSVDTSDKPVDGNPCTQDLCSAQGNPSNPPTAINSACNVNGNDACDGNGTCKKSNSKVCGAGTECVSTNCVDGVCCNGTCTTTCRACNVLGHLGTCWDVPFGTEDGSCSGTSACNTGADCDDKLGQPCSSDGPCLSGHCADGVCCDSACDSACKVCNASGTCSNVAAGQTDNNPTNICTGSNQCDGNGVCKEILGSSCSAAAECLSGYCADGVCCESVCNSVCKVCNASGTCSNVAAGQTDNNPTNICTGMNQCDGNGVCKEILGSPCGAAAECLSGYCVDGVCCESVCDSVCKVCNASGTCSNVAAGQTDNNPTNICTGMNQCDGSGVCKEILGSSCSAASECLSGYCTDGVCCESACNSACKVCNASGACSNVAAGQTDNNPTNICTGMNQCDGNGVCKEILGSPCGAAAECLSGYCMDGVCCESVCDSICTVCNASGTCSNVAAGQTDNNPTNICTGMNQCDGSGACKLKNGETCMMDSECLSNKCVGAPGSKTCQA